MSFIQRELEKIETALRQAPDGDPRADALRIAQQSLHWVLDPDCSMAPSAYLNKFHGTGMAPTAGTGVVFSDLPSAAEQRNARLA